MHKQEYKQLRFLNQSCSHHRPKGHWDTFCHWHPSRFLVIPEWTGTSVLSLHYCPASLDAETSDLTPPHLAWLPPYHQAQPLQQTVPAHSEHKSINSIYSCHTHTNSSNSANTSHYKTNLPKRKYRVHLWLGNTLFSHTLEHLQCAPHHAHSWGYREWRITPTPKRSVGSLSSVGGSRIYHQFCCDSLLWSECLWPPTPPAPPQNYMLKANAQCDGIKRAGL